MGAPPLKSDARKPRIELIAELNELREKLALNPPGSAPDAGASESIPGESARTQQMCEFMRSIIVELDPQGRVVFVSRFASEMLGYDPEEIIKRQNFDWAHQDDHCVLLDHYRALQSSPKDTTTPCRIRHRQGHWIQLETVANTRHDADGTPHFVAITWDAVYGIEQNARISDQAYHYRLLAENASDLIVELDRKGRILFLSPNCNSLLTQPIDALIGKTAAKSDIHYDLHPDDVSAISNHFRTCFKTMQETRFPLRVRFRDDVWHRLECIANPFAHHDGTIHLIVICRDVTASERVRLELQESEERYRIVSEIDGGNIVEYERGEVVFGNAAAQNFWPDSTRYIKLDDEESFKFIHPDDAEACKADFIKLKQPGDTARYRPYRYGPFDGNWMWIDEVQTVYQTARGVKRILEISHDITEQVQEEERRREFDEKLHESRKLESLGVMAGGIAHDFNNLLTPILGEASLSLLDLPADAPIRKRLERIQKSAHRAAALTRQMLDYAGQETGHREILGLSDVVEDMRELLEGIVSGRSILHYDLPINLPTVEADPGQLSQVVMNLITNATEAVTSGEGRIEISTGLVLPEELDPGFIFGGPLPAEESCVYVEVSDNGCGIDDLNQSRIFDPFYTTKFTGRGLGLSASLGMVRSHGGVIECESAVGRGTRIRAIFPRKTQTPVRIAKPISLESENWTGSGTVLIMDDDADVRSLMQETLRRAKLTVLMASDGRHGIELFRRHTAEIRAVVIDRSMPSVDGEQAAKEIRKIRSDVRIILVSGYVEQRAVWEFLDENLDFFLHKPFEPMELINRIRSIFEETSPED